MIARFAAWIAGVAVIGVTAVGCNSSSSALIEPTPIKCAISATPATTLAANGGTGTTSVSAARECAWTASLQAGWLTITSNATGQGDGVIAYAAAPNPSKSPRVADLLINNQRAQVRQEGAVCEFTLSRSTATVDAGGGDITISVTTLADCEWGALSSASWVSAPKDIFVGEGKITLDIAPNRRSMRSTVVTVAGRELTITQAAAAVPEPGGPDPNEPAPGQPAPGEPAPGEPAPTEPPPTEPPPAPVPCTYAISPDSASAGAAGGSQSVAVATADGCGWTAASNASWISLSSSGGSGNASVQLTVAPNSGSASRTGTATIAGRTFTVTQTGAAPAPCSYSISPTSAGVPLVGGIIDVQVETAAACAWSATSHAGWITVSNGTDRSGPGTVRLTVGLLLLGSRSGTVTIAGQTFTVNQSGLLVSSPE